MQAAIENPPTTKATLLLMALLLGYFGFHRFYCGRYASGFLQLISHGGFGLWVLLDVILIISGKFTDRHGRPVTTWF